MRLRQSTIRTWMECPLKAKFETLEGQPRKQHARATWGTCVHHGLEVYSSTGNDVEAAVEAYTAVWDNPELLDAVPDFWPKYMTSGTYREKGIQLIRDHHERIRWEAREVVAWEHQFCVPFGAHELTGTVDLIELRQNAAGTTVMRICDYKTNSSAPSQQELQFNIQFTAYIYASLQPEFWLGNGPAFPPMERGEYYWENHCDTPRRSIWFQLQTNKELDAGGRNEEDFKRLYRVATEIQKAVDRDVFVPDISGAACIWCPHTALCGLEIKSFDEDEEAWR